MLCRYVVTYYHGRVSKDELEEDETILKFALQKLRIVTHAKDNILIQLVQELQKLNGSFLRLFKIQRVNKRVNEYVII